MHQKFWTLNSKWRNPVFLLVSLLLSFSFMHLVQPPGVGLDASWQIAISKAHSENLVWGKDFVFTYGPFSYLFFGSLLDKNYFEMQLARYLLNVVWLFFSLKFAFKLDSALSRIFALLTFIIIPSFVGNNGYYSEAKFVLLILLMILDISSLNQGESEAGNWINFKYYFYGVISTFFLFVKFNFGFLAAVCLLLTIFINLVARKKARQEEEFRFLEISFNWLVFGCLMGLMVFASPLAHYPYAALFSAFLLGLLALFISKTGQFQSLTGRILINERNRALLVLLFPALTVLCIVSNSSLAEFIVSSLQITKGYNQSMGTVGLQSELSAGLFITVSILLLGAIAILLNLRSVGAVLAIFLLTLMSFKHGFIRHDWAHVPLFATAAPAYLFGLGSLFSKQIPDQKAITQKVKYARLIWIIFLSLAITFFISFGVDTSSFSRYYDLSLTAYLSRLSPQVLFSQFSLLAQPQQAQAELLKKKESALAPSRIPSTDTINNLRGKSVDVMPWEVSVAEANQLNWHPLPVFQSYSAYTRWLDNKNLQAYQTNPPDRIIYSFAAIDGRHPYFDQPKTTLFTLCNYVGDRNFQPAATASTGQFAILTKSATPKCALDQVTSVADALTATWDQGIDLDVIRELYKREAGNILIAQIDIQYSLLGMFYNLLFRTPTVYVKVLYKDGQSASYRLVIDTAKSGLMIGSLPISFNESLKELNGEESANQVRAIALATDNRPIFSEKIKLNFLKLKKVAL